MHFPYRSSFPLLLAPSLAFALLVPRFASAESPSVSFTSPSEKLEIFERTGETDSRAPGERGVNVRRPQYAPLCPSPTPCEAPLPLGTHVLGVARPGGSVMEVSESVRIDGPTDVEVKVKDRWGVRAAGWVSIVAGIGTGLTLVLDGLSSSSSHSMGNPESVVGTLLTGISAAVGFGLVLQSDDVQLVVSPVLIGVPRSKEGALPAGAGVTIRF
jgi:hypothetical protein